ncbi:hypothetical protein ABE205_13575 [Brevibacillus agri]
MNVIIVDDEPLALRHMARMLARVGGLNIQGAEPGAADGSG